MSTTRFKKAPAHLSKEAKLWYEEIYKEFNLESAQEKLLEAACDSWDRMIQARKGIKDHGLTFVDRHGSRKPSPEISIERDSRLAFARLVRELSISSAPKPGESRPPIISGRYK
jgi:P27 family predicted phage terminase small subunit